MARSRAGYPVETGRSALPAASLSVQLRHICLEYPYKQLEEATAGFSKSRRLGSGTAGTVYRAEMPDGSDVAVKVIDLSLLGEDSMVAGFEEEIAVLSKFRHPNLVVLMGWARKDSRRFLIYEFLSGGDVFQRLQKCRDNNGKEFLWHERLAAARDAATGLAHLHNATPHAFHRDVKSANILLGGSGAKMADFGLSCVAKTQKDKDVICKFPSGTPGYTCPTYIRSGKVTEGSEVYSFGMVLLEMLLNQMPAGMMKGELVYPIQEIVLPNEPGAIERCLDYADSRARWPHAAACEVAQLALLCIHPDDAHRPRFNEVCRGLRSIQDRYPADRSPDSIPKSLPCDETPKVTVNKRKPIDSLPPVEVSEAVLSAAIGNKHAMEPAAGKQPMPGPEIKLAAKPVAEASAEAPRINRVADESSQAWPEGADVALEVAYVHGINVSSLPFSVRYPSLHPSVDNEGRRSVQLGRHCQPQWFEALLTDCEHRNSVSRVACEVSWGGSSSSASSSAPTLRTLGSNLLVVDREIVHKDQSCQLALGSQIRFMFQSAGNDLADLLMILVHASTVEWEKIGDATVGAKAITDAPHRRPSVENGLVQPQGLRLGPPRRRSKDGLEENWRLELVFAVGLAPEAILRLPKIRRTFCCSLYRGCPPVSFGRQNQMAMFEALLCDGHKELLSFVSREHLQFDVSEDGTPRVTNKSQNITFMGTQILQRGEAVQMMSGDTLSFAAEARLIEGAEATLIVTGDGVKRELAPFLTFRLVKTFAGSD
mmetsp:Transcript_123785/g.214595  ORF Transcript_123785/g.214595 Transcript_123785/m.214595 type:complete len:767 (+) Transcript_123785:97-2397(+)